MTGVSVTEVSADGAPLTVSIAALLVTFPDTTRMCEVTGVWPVFCATPEPFVTGLPSEVQVMGAVKGWLFWSNAVAVKVNDAPGATVRADGAIEIWSKWGVGGVVGVVGDVGGVVDPLDVVERVWVLVPHPVASAISNSRQAVTRRCLTA